VDGEIERVVPGDIEAATRVIEREAEMSEGTARQSRVRRRAGHPIPTEAGGNNRILDQCADVVEDEWAVERIRVDDAGDARDQRSVPPPGRLGRRAYFPNPQIASCGGSLTAA
jgi:hypothetical protein